VILALSEPGSTAVLLAVIGVLLAACAVFTRALDRIGVPVVLIFLVMGMLGGAEGLGRIDFNDNHFA
jgi:cell volume regulation protein A